MTFYIRIGRESDNEPIDFPAHAETQEEAELIIKVLELIKPFVGKPNETGAKG